MENNGLAYSLQKIMQHAPALVALLLLGLMAVQLAKLTLLWFFNPQVQLSNTSLQTPSPTSQVSSNKSNNPVMQYANLIRDQHLFGKASAIEAQPQPEIIDAPETKENLKLLGILATGNQEGLAIIASGGSPEAMYRIGESLPGNSTLNSVYADRVIIKNSRGLETLRIELDKNRLDDISSTEGNLPQVSSRESIAATTPAPNERLTALRQEIIRDPLSFTQKITIQPEKDAAGQLLGYKLDPKEDQALFEELGFQPGDVATSINGLDLRESKNARRAMNILRRSRKINMTVMRNGQEITLEQQL